MVVKATESGFNQTVQKDQATLIAELISRVTSLEDSMEFVLEHIKILEVDRQIEVISPSWGEDKESIEERNEGRWIDHKRLIMTDPEIWGYSQECSLCGFVLGAKEYNYCPECGARMIGE